METEKILINGHSYNKNNLGELIQISNEVWQMEIVQFLINWFDDSEFIEVFTSGSTGKPKAILLSKQSMRNSARMTNNFFGLNHAATALLCLPASYIAGKMMLVRAIIGNFNLLAIAPMANPFVKINQNVDFVAITPYQLLHSISIIDSKDIKNIIVGGSKINQELELKIQELECAFFETYGMTETCSHIALRALNGKNRSDYFQTLKGVKIRINEHNCLCVSANYLLDAEIITNDVVELKESDKFRWIGRLDNVINTAGIKVQPEEVEKKIEKIISEPFFISSIPDRILGNKIILLIESDYPGKQVEDNLFAQLRLRLTKYECPKSVFYIAKFCYSATNKILKSETLKLILHNEELTK